MELKQLTAQNLKDLIAAEIAQLRGISGVMTTVEIAKQAPGLVQMHTMRGDTFDIVSYIAELDTFNVEKV